MHVDWHPEKRFCLGTGSIDKTINVSSIYFLVFSYTVIYYLLLQLITCLEFKIWDFSVSDKNSINNMALSDGVVSLKWRPGRPTQITTLSQTGFDSHLYVRPFQKGRFLPLEPNS